MGLWGMMIKEMLENWASEVLLYMSYRFGFAAVNKYCLINRTIMHHGCPAYIYQFRIEKPEYVIHSADGSIFLDQKGQTCI